MGDDHNDEYERPGSRPELSTGDPLFLFTLFRSDVIAAEVDWENERFRFYPLASIPDPRE